MTPPLSKMFPKLNRIASTMPEEWIYYLWALLLFLANVLAWASNLFIIPGNWIILALSVVFALFYPEQAEQTRGLSWTAVAVVLGLAVLGEILEFLAGAAGAAQQGGSRRGMALAIVGAVLGSLAGAAVTLPVPVLGPILGALGGGAAGAFLGAYLGELWKGRTSDQSLNIGKGALVGRLLGTVGKMGVGAVMVVVVTLDSFFI